MSKGDKGNRFDHLEFEEPAPRFEQVLPQQEQRGVLGSEPMARHQYHERAIEAFRRGEFDRALRYFTRTLELDRAFVPAWVGQVQMLIELNELREADMWAAKALELFRDNGELQAARGVAKARLGDSRAAMACSDAAMAARGTSAYRWLARGEILAACGYEQVDSTLARALLEPDADWFSQLCVARIYRKYGRRTQAVVAAREATDRAPHAPFAWCVRGLCERDLAMGGFRASLERALELDSGYAPARAALREPAQSSWLIRWYRRVRRK